MQFSPRLIHTFTVFLFIAVFFPAVASAATYSDNFDSYTAGNLTGQGPWTQVGGGSGHPQVTTAQADSSPNSVTRGGSISTQYALGSSVGEIYVEYDFYWDGEPMSSNQQYSYFQFGDIQTLRGTTGEQWQVSGGTPLTVQIPEDQWVNLKFYLAKDLVVGDNWYVTIYVDDVLSFTGSLALSATPTYNFIDVQAAMGGDQNGHMFADNLVLAWDGDIPPQPGGDESTRIISVVPPDDPNNLDARATSTTFAIEGTGFVDPLDYVDNMSFRINIKNNAGVPTNSLVGPGYSSGGVAICNWLFDWLCPPSVDDDTQITGAQTSIINRTFEWDIVAEEDFDFATTTNLQQIGRYTLTASILAPTFNVFGVEFGNRTLVSTSTSFFVATSTWYDVSHDAAVALTDQLVASAGAANCEIDFTTLFGLLDLGDCLIYIYSGGTEYVAEALSVQIADLTSRVPWGYATRIYIIFAGETSTSTLPSLATHIPAGLPFEGTEFDFTPWTHIGTAVDTLSTTIPEDQTESALDIFEFWWNFMWIIVFVIWLIGELYGTFGGVDMEHNPESTYRGSGGRKYKVVGKSPVRVRMHVNKSRWRQ